MALDNPRAGGRGAGRQGKPCPGGGQGPRQQMGRNRRPQRRLRGTREEPRLPPVPSGGRNWRDAQGQTAPARGKQGSREGAEGGGERGYTSPGGQGRRSPRSTAPGGARGSRRLCTPRAAGALHPARPLLTWELEAKAGVYRWAPGLFPAPLADMAADELSPGLLGSPAARVEETPLPSRPASLRSPLPAGPPATAEHRARAAREDARRADDHRVRSLEGPPPRRSTHSPPASAPGRKRK